MLLHYGLSTMQTVTNTEAPLHCVQHIFIALAVVHYMSLEGIFGITGTSRTKRQNLPLVQTRLAAYLYIPSISKLAKMDNWAINRALLWPNTLTTVAKSTTCQNAMEKSHMLLHMIAINFSQISQNTQYQVHVL